MKIRSMRKIRFNISNCRARPCRNADIKLSTSLRVVRLVAALDGSSAPDVIGGRDTRIVRCLARDGERSIELSCGMSPQSRPGRSPRAQGYVFFIARGPELEVGLQP